MDVIEIIKKALTKTVGIEDVVLEKPELEDYGDYSTNIAMRLWSKHEALNTKHETMKKSKNNFQNVSDLGFRISDFSSPRTLAQYIIEILQKDKELMEYVDRIEVAGPGFINFHLSRTVLARVIGKILSDIDKYGSNNSLKDKKILLEHTSPNPQTTIMLGHLRNNFLGMSVANILEFQGAKVVKDCIVNDRGIHICRSIFGYLVFAHKDSGLSTDELINYKEISEEKINSMVKDKNWKELLKTWNDDNSLWLTPDDLNLKSDHANLIWYVLGSSAFKLSKEVHAQVKEILTEWEKENEEVWSIWKNILDWSDEGYAKTYDRIGSIHDWVWKESDLYKEGKELVLGNIETGIFQNSDGAIVSNLGKYDLPDLVAVKSDGTATYLVFDINLTKQKIEKFPSDLYIWTIGNEQALYFKQLFSICEQLGMGKKKNFFHLSYGLINFKGSGKMSTRRGDVITADNVLDELEGKVKEIIVNSNQDLRGKLTDSETEKLTQKIALSSVKYGLLKYSRESTIYYDIDESISLEGNSGPYLLYTYARTKSVFAKSQIKNHKLQITTNEKIPNYKLNKEELSLLRTFVHFPQVVQEAGERYAPNLICNYLYDVAQKYNVFYNKHKILGDDDPIFKLRLKLNTATGIILKNGLGLLGIQSPERM